MSESLEQQTFIQWCNLNANRYEGLDLIFHIPNGGTRYKMEAVKLKREGVKAGVPDLFLPVPKNNFNGLFIEMKYGRNKPTGKQKEWIERLNSQGYKAVVCWSCDEAIEVVKGYYI